MRKFYMMMLAMLCVVSTAMAQLSDRKPLDVKKALKTEVQTTAKQKTGLMKSSKLTATKHNLDQIEKMGGTHVVGMRKADANPSIEGTWTFDLGDYYFQTSVGSFTCDFEATLEGDELWFEDPTGYELPFVAEFNEATNTLTFNRTYLGSTGQYYIYQQPFVWNGDLDYQPITATYYASYGVISFDAENGLAWEACTNQAGSNRAGYFSIYDLEGATYVGEPEPAEPIDEEQAGQWTSVGMATFVDAWIMPSYSMGVNQINPNEYAYEVELQQNVANPNLYRLWEPYKNSILSSVNTSTYHGQIVFDISDPDHVEVVASGMPAGFKNNQGEFYMANELGWYVNQGYEKDVVISVLYGDEPADTYQNGVVTITTPMFDFSAAQNDGYAWNNNPYSSIITFPASEEELEINVKAATQYATFVAPFEYDVPDNMQAFTVTGVAENGTTLTLEEITGTVAENTPVLLYAETGATATVSGVNKATGVTTVQVEGNLLTGVYSTVEVPQGGYVLQNLPTYGVNFYIVDGTSAEPITVSANHAYLMLPEGSNGVKAIGFGDVVTAIKGLEAAKAAKTGIYNVQGQRLNSLQKGINIVDGKKVVIK